MIRNKALRLGMEPVGEKSRSPRSSRTCSQPNWASLYPKMKSIYSDSENLQAHISWLVSMGLIRWEWRLKRQHGNAFCSGMSCKFIYKEKISVVSMSFFFTFPHANSNAPGQVQQCDSTKVIRYSSQCVAWGQTYRLAMASGIWQTKSKKKNKKQKNSLAYW